jgi:hypothetical protein
MFSFLCDCSRKTTLPMYRVTTGNSTSCGHCNDKPKEYWLSQCWGELRLTLNQPLPEEWGAVKQKFEMLCSCSRVCQVSFKDILRGHTVSCGKCSWKSKAYWLSQTWGSLKLADIKELPSEWPPFSIKRFRFSCSCSRSSTLEFSKVTTGNTTSCGNCSLVSKDVWLDQHWGSLTLSSNQSLPEFIRPYCTSKYIFNCSCGRQISLDFGSVTSTVKNHAVRSCGKCQYQPKSYWLQQKWGRLTLDPNQSTPEEWGPGWKHPLWFLCSCGKRKKCIFTYVLRGDTGSCGCMVVGQNEFSKENEVRQFVLTLSPDTCPTSYSIEGTRKSYDVYVPSAKLAIEYHGLNWHSEQFKRGQQDETKFLLARSRGDHLIQIYSDEWEQKQEIIKAQLREILAPEKKIRIKPTFETYTKTPSEARAFLDAHHYLGAASGCLTVIAKADARHGSAVVGVWVFMKREEGVILWHRACWHPAYKAWNPHEKALKLALSELRSMGFKRMVTFSDNRFHTGQLYEKLGFKFEEEIRADYGYTNGLIRKSKYALRVPAGVDEKASAEAKGWYRIWDSGKKRFSFLL